MNSKSNNMPIGVFDSGIGGLSVLNHTLKILPNENYIYIGDFANAPYGVKGQEQILDISIKNADMLCSMNIKALLIACNTATSAAAHILRQRLNIPVVGLEPAIKPASLCAEDNKSIVVLATPQTLRLDKFNNLLKQFNSNVLPIACPGLSRLIETAGPKSSAIKEYLSEILNCVNRDNTSSIVLGCTHFSFVAEEIQNITGGIKLFDGRFGAARQLKRVLKDNLSDNEGSVKLISTIDDEYHNNLLNRFINYQLLEE
jgi:glutamate racemase